MRHEGDPNAALRRLEFLGQFKQFASNAFIEELANRLVESGGLPPKARADAAHLATAARNEIHYLLTWNCKHLANPRLFSRIKQVLAAQGLHCPTICTPEQIMEHLDHDEF